MTTPHFKEYILKRPGMFFGDRGVNAVDVCTEIARGAMALGARKTQIGLASSWYFICADIDWLSVSLKHEYKTKEDVFEKMHPFPEYFVNSVRYEPMTKFFSDALITYDGKNLELIKGKELDIELFEEEMPDYSQWKRIIGFRFNEHA